MVKQGGSNKNALNLNVYKGQHYISQNNTKKKFKFMVRDQLKGIELETPVEITYQIFKPRKNRLDKMNLLSIQSKYLLDALSEYEVWPDDNDEYVKTETLLPTLHDKDNPRVEVVFKTIKVDL
tara:strand:+ start:204 stop:572 length:369 start_codon:yes stop_codon:yes gene_type:complete